MASSHGVCRILCSSDTDMMFPEYCPKKNSLPLFFRVRHVLFKIGSLIVTTFGIFSFMRGV